MTRMPAVLNTQLEPEDFRVRLIGEKCINVYEPTLFDKHMGLPAKFGLHVPFEVLPPELLPRLHRREDQKYVWIRSNYRPPIEAPDPQALANELCVLDALNSRRDDALIGRNLEVGVRPYSMPDNLPAGIASRMPEDAISLVLLYVKILEG